LIQAKPESPLVFFLCLTLLLGVVGGRNRRTGDLPVVWTIAAGLALGLALATKLTAIFSLAAVLGWATLLGVLAGWRARLASCARSPSRDRPAAAGWATVVVLGLVVFVASNPHLYPNPILHTAHLFAHRARTMQEQQARHPAKAVRDPMIRLGYVLEGSLVNGTATAGLGIPLEPVLAATGGVVLLVRLERGWRSARR